MTDPKEVKLNWDDPQVGGDETYTEDDVKSAEAMGKMPLGRFLCTCAESTPKQMDFSAYSCIAANLKWRVDRVLELGGKAIEGDEADEFIGRFMYDDIAMFAPEEKDGMRKRRILIAKRVGLISTPDGTITKSMWATGIIGKCAVITNEDQKSKDGTKTYRKIAFSGYESADAATETKPADNFDEV